MKNSVTTAIVLSIIAIVGGMVLNFSEFLMGSPATIKNFIVTFGYIVIWIQILKMAIDNGNRGIMIYSSVFWLITLLLAILMGYVNVTGAQVDWVLPFAILLLGQWYGINLFVGSFLATSIIIAILSFVMLTITLIVKKRV